jgi:hypothetical protein
MTDKQPEALRLADELEDSLESHDGSSLTARCQGIADDAAAELRRLHAENTTQQQELTEQARLLGISAEKELALRAEVDALKRGYEAARLEIESLRAAQPAAQPSYEHQRAIMEGERNASLDAYSRVVSITSAESRLYERAFTSGWDRRDRLASHGQAPAQDANEYLDLLAQCRSAFPIPERGDPLEVHWAAARADPGEVPGYLQEIAAARHAAQAAPAAVAGPSWGALHHAWMKIGADVAGLDWGAFTNAVHYAPTTQPAPQQEAQHLAQALTDRENQPNQYGVEFGMSGTHMHFKIGNQLFKLAYEPDEQEEFDFMKRMLVNAFSTFTHDVKTASQPSPTAQAAESVPALPEITAEDRSFLHYNPNTDDIVEWVHNYASAAITAARASAESVLEDAARYRLVRRGQHWSVINGIGNGLRAEELDAAIDAAMAAQKERHP